MKRRAGFTLIELLVTVTIFSGILGALLISFFVGRKSYLSADAYIEVQQEGRRGLDAMTTEIREAGPATAAVTVPGPAAGGVLTFQTALGWNLATGGCPAGLCLGAVDAASNPQSGWTIQYSIDPATKQLLRKVFDNGALPAEQTALRRVLANNVNAPDNVTSPYTPFTYNSADTVVAIQLQVQKSSAQLPNGATGTATVNARVKLRNN